MFENRIDLRHGSIWSIIAHFKTDYKNVIKYQYSGAVFFLGGEGAMKCSRFQIKTLTTKSQNLSYPRLSMLFYGAVVLQLISVTCFPLQFAHRLRSCFACEMHK